MTWLSKTENHQPILSKPIVAMRSMSMNCERCSYYDKDNDYCTGGCVSNECCISNQVEIPSEEEEKLWLDIGSLNTR